MEQAANSPLDHPQELPLEDGWRLGLAADGLTLTGPDGRSQEIPRARALEAIERLGLEGFSRTFFVLREPKRKIFKLGEANAAIFNRWLGDDYRPELLHQLKHRMGQSIPFGLLALVTNHGDWTGWTMGGLMLLQGILFRLRPTHWLFLLETLFWVVSAVRNALLLATSGGVFPMVLLVLSVLFLAFSVKIFLRFSTALRRRSTG